MGIIVDEVSEVVDITSDQIEEPPTFGDSVNTEFIMGMGKFEQKVIMLLDIEKVLTKDEISSASALF
jgi:purine-binding chemotaxis protein CheW